MMTMAPGAERFASSMIDVMMGTLTLSTSERDMPGLRGRPAVMMMMSERARASRLLWPVSFVSYPNTGADS